MIMISIKKWPNQGLRMMNQLSNHYKMLKMKKKKKKKKTTNNYIKSSKFKNNKKKRISFKNKMLLPLKSNKSLRSKKTV